jgi:membrane protein required for colicin V production
MNWLDIVIIVFLAVIVVTGLSKGLIKTLLPLIGIVVGIALAGQFYDSMASWLSNWLESENQAKIVGFIIIFSLVMIVAFILASILSRFLSLLFLGWLDKLAGGVLGFFLAGFVCGAILTILTKFGFMEDSIRDSSVATFFVDRFPMVLPLLPKEFDSVRQFFG